MDLADTLENQWVPYGAQISQNNFEPASDMHNMHTARLEIKYWDTSAILYRPFVENILAASLRQSPGSHPYPSAISEGVGIVAPYVCDNVEMHEKSLVFAKRGLKAIIASTEAFYRFKHRRPIIVNVVRAAHVYVLESKSFTGWMAKLTLLPTYSQWGNLLVLSAAFRNPTLGESVDGRTLQSLFDQAVAFFQHCATDTNPLTLEITILEKLKERLFHNGRSITTGEILALRNSLQFNWETIQRLTPR
jgi:hypothetical protein